MEGSDRGLVAVCRFHRRDLSWPVKADRVGVYVRYESLRASRTYFYGIPDDNATLARSVSRLEVMYSS